VITDFSAYSIMVILSGLGKLDELKTFLTSLSPYKGLSTYATTLLDKVRAVDICLAENLDIDDSIQYSAALACGAESIVSFDKHLDELGIPRVEPQDVPSMRQQA